MNETHVYIYIPTKKENSQDDDINPIILQKNIALFFKNLEVEGLGEATTAKIINAGFNSIPKILAMNKEDFLKVENFKDKMATKVYNSIREQIKDKNLPEIAAASNIFERGFGKTKLEAIFSSYPQVFAEIQTSSPPIDQIKKQLNDLPNMATKTS